MKKVLSLMLITGMITFGGANLYAQEETTTETTEAAADSTMDDTMDSTATEEAPAEAPAETETATATEEEVDTPFTQVLKEKFIEGGASFMGIVLIVLILGLAIAIERILYLTFSISNNDKLLKKVEEALANGGIEAAKEACRTERGPVASIFYEGLDHYDEGIEMVDKSIIASGSVENGKLEKGVSWLSLFIALAPMLGFMGTVIGMIDAFDAIEAAGDISPSLVAGGIKVALLTTVFGLITAIILQIFYNLIIAMIDSIVIKMEDASISFMDLVVDFNKKNK
ncbi:MAG: MotA/TolQ/ExbB proton channel family protein [Schleiferiaceae bacterium]